MGASNSMEHAKDDDGKWDAEGTWHVKIVVEIDQMRLVELKVPNRDFFKKLMDIFHVCEDLENLHGKFLKEHVIFKEAIPIKNPLVLSMIHQNYRIRYLKDVVLGRAIILDESTIENLNSIIQANNVWVVCLLADDSTFIKELLVRLKLPTTSEESKKNLVHFLLQFCRLSEKVHTFRQARLLRDLVKEGIFDVIADVLHSSDTKFVLTGTDMFILFLDKYPNHLRFYVGRKQGIPLLGLLVQGLITDFGEEIMLHYQFFQILKCLLDSSQREAVVEIFYQNHLGQLIDVITLSCPPSEAGNVLKNQSVVVVVVKPDILYNICELLCCCVLRHPYKINTTFLMNNVIHKVLLLTQRKEKYLVVAAVRFVRTILSRRHHDHDHDHDVDVDDLMSYFIENNLLKPIIDALVANGNRCNLLSSAVLDLLEYIRKENMKSLVKYIVDSFWNQLVQFHYLPSIQSLKLKYDEQCLEEEPAFEKEDEDEDEDEEDFFNGETQTKQSFKLLIIRLLNLFGVRRTPNWMLIMLLGVLLSCGVNFVCFRY